MSAVKLEAPELDQRLRDLPLWSLANGKLHREYRFADFTHAFAFMAACATVAEAMNHHPEWFNVWNRVVVDLTTHDAGGISVKDFDLAARMEALAGKLQG